MKRVVNGNPTDPNSTRDFLGVTGEQSFIIIDSLQDKWKGIQILKELPFDMWEEVFKEMQLPIEKRLTPCLDSILILSETQAEIMKMLHIMNAPHQLMN